MPIRAPIGTPAKGNSSISIIDERAPEVTASSRSAAARCSRSCSADHATAGCSALPLTSVRLHAPASSRNSGT